MMLNYNQCHYDFIIPGVSLYQTDSANTVQVTDFIAAKPINGV